MADDPWLSGDCQSISDGQGYSDSGTIQDAWLTTVVDRGLSEYL